MGSRLLGACPSSSQGRAEGAGASRSRSKEEALRYKNLYIIQVTGSVCHRAVVKEAGKDSGLGAALHFDCTRLR